MLFVLTLNRLSHNSLLLLLLASTLVFAQAQTSRQIALPDSYRTPLSDLVYKDNKKWRAKPEQKNPWRGNKDDEVVKPRIRAHLFPQYNYDSVEDPNPGSLFQNQNEIEKPVSNIFRYNF